MFKIRPKRQGIKVRGRDRSRPIKEFKLATGHRAVLRSGDRLVKVLVQRMPKAGDRTFRGEVLAVKASDSPAADRGVGSSQPTPQIGSVSEFTLANVYAVQV